ncbi:MAG: DegQ family serine endoprotease [Azospirillaceae bacterium]
MTDAGGVVKSLVWAVSVVVLVAMMLVMQVAAVKAQDQSRPASFADLAEELLPSVVNISTTQLVSGGAGQELPEFPPGSPFEDFFDQFRNPPDNGPPRRATALGSGFIIDPEGVVITNNHVIDAADEIRVILQDGTEFAAEVVGTDPETDVAVLRVETDEPLPAVSWGDSDAARVGDWIIAIGNPFGLGGSVSAGIVSARGRDIQAGRYDDFIQTDAAINRGNSGGPMFNMDGEVVGINSAIFSPTGASVGIGFAIPSNLAQNVVGQILEFGRTRRGWLGVRIQTVTDDIAESLGMAEAEGALVASVTPEGPAAMAGLEAGDVILSFNGEPIEEMRELPRVVAETEVGSSVPVEVFRRGETQNFEVTLGELEVAEEQGLLAQGDGGDAVEREIADLGLTVSGLNDELREQYALPPDSSGVVITAVEPDSAAAEEGLVAGELIVEVGQEPVGSPDDVVAGIEEAREQDRRSVLMLVSRDGQLRFVALPLEE